MAQAYSPGLKVTPRLRLQCRRVLPIAGNVLVKTGDRVSARDVVARTELLGDAVPLNLAKLLGVTPGELSATLKTAIGQPVAKGDVLAESTGLFGWFRSTVKSPAAGTLESVSTVTGQAILRGPPLAVDVRAYLTGTVVEVLPQEGVVVESDAALIQGIFGIGGEAYGRLQVVAADAAQPLTAEQLNPTHRGAIVVGGGRLTLPAVRKAQELGVAALIASGLDDQDLTELLGFDLGVAVTGSERLGLTIVITEGFGDIAMARRTLELLRRHHGAEASVNGTTQIRAGVLRPEIVIPLTSVAGETVAAPRPPVLEPGVPVRVIREPLFGALGTVKSLPPEPQVLASESKARVVDVQLNDGRVVVTPRANVELIEE